MSRLYVARNPRVAARSLDGEMMIMSGRDSTLFTLNKTATILWQSADGTTPLDEIVEHRICRRVRSRARRSAARRRNSGARTGQP